MYDQPFQLIQWTRGDQYFKFASSICKPIILGMFNHAIRITLKIFNADDELWFSILL
jgi:hypothetical protein